MGFTEVFSGSVLYPSDVSYLPLALTADTILQWPLEASTGSNLVARIIDVTPTGAFSIFMPPANQTAPGQVTQFTNLGPSTITVKDNNGDTLLSITQGLSFTLYLTDNTTAAGLWRAFQAGASTAQAQASALAGLGLIAQGSLLSQSQPVVTFNVNYTTGAADRASTYIWTGALGTLTLTAASVLGNNWFESVYNAGSGNLTVQPSGIDEINGASSLVLRPGDSATINCSGVAFYTIGLGQNPVFAFDYTSIDLTGLSGTYTLSGSELNRIAYDFVGALAGDITIVVPATTQQYWVANDTTGGSFLLNVGTATQASPVNVVRAGRGIYYCNGSVVVNADTASIATPIAIADGGSGATTASGARINFGGTTVGIAVFTAAGAAAGRSALTAAASGANADITSLTGLTTPLSVAQGGTGESTFTTHGVLIGNGTGGLSIVAPGTAGQVLTANTGADPTFQTPSVGSGTVTSVSGSGGTTGLTLTGGPITGVGTLTLGGTLAVVNGGTGVATITGIPIGTGTAALGIAVAGSDYVSPSVATDFTATQTFAGSTSVPAMLLFNAAEVATVSATAATGTIVLHPSTQSVVYYTTAASANWTLNLTFSAGTTLNTALVTGESMTVTFMVTQGASPFYNNVVQVDGTTLGVTTKWLGGAPVAGNASGIDVYTYCVLKTSSAAFTVFASVAQFK